MNAGSNAWVAAHLVRFGSMQVTSVKLDYDEEASSGTILVTGIADSPFSFVDGRMENGHAAFFRRWSFQFNPR